MTVKERFIGSRAFYQRLFAVMLPILLQMVITQFVSLLDNIMVGRLGTEEMSGVAIVNQLLFIFNICMISGVSGAGIYTAQFYGSGDWEGVRSTFRAKAGITAGILALALAIFAMEGKLLISLFIHEGSEGLDMQATFGYAESYLHVMLFGLLPYAVTQMYASAFKETGETVLPMKAGIVAVLVNLVLNYILIFGKLGAPVLGVVGAATATVISRWAECLILVLSMHTRPEKYPAYVGVYRKLGIPKDLLFRILTVTLPLLVNEMLWSGGETVKNQCYSLRGLEVVSAVNITSTVSNLFFCAFFAMGSTVSILVGQTLGSGDISRAVDEDRKLTAVSVLLCVATGAVMAALSPLIPHIYNTTEGVRSIATRLIFIAASMMPFYAYTNCCYFTLRSGGRTLITFIFDSGFLWIFGVSAAFILSRFTAVDIVSMYRTVCLMELVKCVFGYLLVRRPERWARNLTAQAEE